ncbi:MAG: TIGR00725 family protein [Anaerolineales bacterium]
MTDRWTPIAVIGPAQASPEELALAEELGRLLAEQGAVLICGGTGGVMEAACRGAAGAGGLTVGILPGSDPEAANPFVRVSLPTGLGEARNAVLMTAASAVIAVGGGYGTLSEIGFALKQGRRVVGLKTWTAQAADGSAAAIRAAADPRTAVDWALATRKA